MPGGYKPRARKLEVEDEDRETAKGGLSAQDADFSAFSVEAHPYPPLCNTLRQKESPTGQCVQRHTSFVQG